MNPRQTHIRAIDINGKIFDTYDTAIKEANALKAYIKYTCEKKGFACIAFIGVSKCDSNKINPIHTLRYKIHTSGVHLLVYLFLKTTHNTQQILVLSVFNRFD